MATPVTRPKGGPLRGLTRRHWRHGPAPSVLHAQALHGNAGACPRTGQRPDPEDGHTLGPVVAEMETLTGVEVRRIHLDKGYRGHTYPNKFRVRISGQVRRVS